MHLTQIFTEKIHEILFLSRPFSVMRGPHFGVVSIKAAPVAAKNYPKHEELVREINL